MILRALDGGVPARWVAADEVYGGNPTLRADLERRQVGYVLAVACDHRVSTATGTRRTGELACYRCYAPDRVPLGRPVGRGASHHD